ncbi:MAG: pitrilysin family protein, partial [Pseudomonadota bacterium]
DEPPGKSGIAHFLEHLMFKGTETLAPGEFSKTVAAHGGTDNAFTSWDFTGYFQRVAADRLGLMMEMEASRMHQLRLTEDQVLPELGVVLEERSQRTDSDPDALMNEQRRAVQFLTHPYGNPIVGWRHEMETLTMADAQAFYDQHYGPNNAILIVAGDVSPDEVRALAETHYGPISPNPNVKPRVRVQEPPQLAARRMIFEDPRVAQPYVSRSYLAPERDPGDQKTAAAVSMLALLLGGDPATSFLGQRLQFDSQEALYTAAFYRGVWLDDTTFNVVMVPAQGVSLEDGEAALDEALAQFLAEPIDVDRMESIKRRFRASEIYARDNVDGVARRYGEALTAGLTVDDIKAWPEIVESLTPEDVKAAAELVFNIRQSVTAYMTPPAPVQTAEEVTQ